MKKVLMIAYHFPPLAGSSGIQRTLRLVQHLPALGWQPLVLTTHPRAYERTSPDLLTDVPPGTVVRRAFALDAARHLTLAGRYAAWMARPDRWISWKFDAVRQGMQMIRQYRPDMIWSTYPIATAHVIGHALHRRTGLPWVADFRDPMAQDGYPADPVTWSAYEGIEQAAALRARWCVFTSPGAADMYRQRFPAAAERMVVVENGYDDESFAAVEPVTAVAGRPGLDRPLLLLHSGIVYPQERDPTQLFQAIGALRAAGRLASDALRIRFRASAHDAMLLDAARNAGAEAFVEICPPIPYRAALTEMMQADVLLAMQASNCNAQIPAKVYEYLRARRPILGLTDPAGDTAGVLRNAGVSAICRLDNADEIASCLLDLVMQCRHDALVIPDPAAAARSSRRARSGEMAELLARALVRA